MVINLTFNKTKGMKSNILIKHQITMRKTLLSWTMRENRYIY